MRPNTTKRKLLAGEPAIGIFASSASPLVAEALGGIGFDWILVDLQHGENNLGNRQHHAPGCQRDRRDPLRSCADQ